MAFALSFARLKEDEGHVFIQFHTQKQAVPEHRAPGGTLTENSRIVGICRVVILEC
jgi:hypothetical protein